MSQSNEFAAISKELDHARAGIERTLGAVNAGFGAVLPAIVGIFTFLAKEKAGDLQDGHIALTFIAVFAMSSIWVQLQWMEAMRYVRYCYLQLMPRYYAASEQSTRPNLLEWEGMQRGTRWIVVLLLDGCGALMLVLAASVVWNCPPFAGAFAFACAFLLATLVAVCYSLTMARRTQQSVDLRWQQHLKGSTP